jgi:Protein of unknown function (DUF559)
VGCACIGLVASMPVTPLTTKASRSRRSRGRCSISPRRSNPTAWSGRSRRPSACSSTTTERSPTSWQERTGRGTGALTKATSREDPQWTRSELEAWFLALARGAGLPEPLVNFILAAPDHPRLEVDFYWPTHDLIVELDGWDTHRTRAAFESDRARDAALHAAGCKVLRFTWRTDAETIQRRLQALLHH